MYSSTLSLTSALDRGGWSTPSPGRFTSGKDLVPIALEARWVPEPVWTGEENLVPTGIRSPERPVRSFSLYGLQHTGPHVLSSMTNSKYEIQFLISVFDRKLFFLIISFNCRVQTLSFLGIPICVFLV